MEIEKETFKKYRRRALKIARDFGYPNDIRKRIEVAENETQIINILHDAREAYL